MFVLFFKVLTYLERTLDLELVSIPHHLFVCELSATKIVRQTTPCAILQNPLLDFRDKEGTRRRLGRSPSRPPKGLLCLRFCEIFGIATKCVAVMAVKFCTGGEREGGRKPGQKSI